LEELLCECTQPFIEEEHGGPVVLAAKGQLLKLVEPDVLPK